MGFRPCHRGRTSLSGPTGAYATVGAAITAAQKYPGHHEILLQEGTYFENLTLAMSDQSLAISGG